jgi:transcriptional regulator with XRE-family HTH domain
VNTNLEPQPNLLPKLLGNALRTARLKRKWGVRELARRIGVHPGLFPAWEQGQRTPNPLTVALILGALGVVDDEQERILDLAFLARLAKVLPTYSICTCSTPCEPVT